MAEHTIGMMLASVRNLAPADRSTQAGKWQRSLFTRLDVLDGKTLGILGSSDIAKIVAELASGLSMNVVLHDPISATEGPLVSWPEIVSFDELLVHSDFVTLHTRMTKLTKGMINKETIAKMKRGVRIVQCEYV